MFIDFPSHFHYIYLKVKREKVKFLCKKLKTIFVARILMDINYKEAIEGSFLSDYHPLIPG